ncbi:hypothetical protein [Candidatus Sororendozoicomonas aggregata]|uniref:hypothetical protein n=1 Tax=Candidatus Sororendozoicomonas aggregata TaxID=3073239 RepID=UPI002ED61963
MSKITGSSGAAQPAAHSNSPADNNTPEKPQNTRSDRVSQLPADAVQPTATKAERESSAEQTFSPLAQRQIAAAPAQGGGSLSQGRQPSHADQLAILEVDIQIAAQRLAVSARNNKGQCQHIETLLNNYMDRLQMMGNPPYATRELALIHGYLQEQLAQMPPVHKGFTCSNPNTNCQFLSEMADKVNDKIIAIMRAPDYIFDDLEIPGEIEEKMRTLSKGYHDDDIAAMKANWNEKGLLVMPDQTRVDLTRNIIRIHNGSGICFDNSALCIEHGKAAYEGEAAAKEVRQAIEDQIINNLDDLPIDTRMQIFSHINQTELNHMYFSLHATLKKKMPDWGTLSRQNPEQAIDIIRDKNSARIIYNMNSRPTFLREDSGEVLEYDGQSRVSLSRTITIDNSGNVDYGKTKVQIYLHAVG